MLTLIRNANLFTPSAVGLQDVLFGTGGVITIAEPGSLHVGSLPCHEVDAKGSALVPGLVDPLVHISGGGGEGGFHTRTPEMQLTEATLAGVTTLVGALGTDAVSRSLEDLLAKARGLANEGLTTYIYTGSYEYPVKTLTGDITRDMMLIDKVIGVGEIAIADHRGSQLSAAELARVASQARVGGMLSGKGGIVFVHVGDGKGGLDILSEVAGTTDIPLSQFYPTHINRSRALLEQGVAFALAGGVIDFTASENSATLNSDEISAIDAVKHALAAGVAVSQITLSSDGNASLPVFDADGRLTGLEVGRVGSLAKAFRDLISEGIAVADALAMTSSNAARILGLDTKGAIAEGKDADLVLLNDQFEPEFVWCLGKAMVANGLPLVRGTFEIV
ncbi:beta-aspartyl-peptidase [Shewanella amazonensis]|uniref:Isoaspartyl dipeptidase n=1 Tax=Shewanella amazonensis (strain ATCC BAA-1098 / SB2B) TaxID=326297 RepID=A1S889_SHEAM|nr:beta-aspartyl-peptidase [Shewanella amazonensis]ABM00596.1 isoaspartyl dipeptidase [Shewanella amazonensis SB2B]